VGGNKKYVDFEISKDAHENYGKFFGETSFRGNFMQGIDCTHCRRMEKIYLTLIQATIV
jgi:hypothetical protein